MNVLNRSHEFSTTAIHKPFRALVGNPNRVYIAIVTLSGTGKLLLCISPPTSSLPAFADALATNNLQYLRKDWGPIVTNDIWVTDGLGHDPNAHWVITEGILTPDSMQTDAVRPKPVPPAVISRPLTPAEQIADLPQQIQDALAQRELFIRAGINPYKPQHFVR